MVRLWHVSALTLQNDENVSDHIQLESRSSFTSLLFLWFGLRPLRLHLQHLYSPSLCLKRLTAPSVIILPLSSEPMLGRINKPSVAYWEPIVSALPRRLILLFLFFSLLFSVHICLVVWILISTENIYYLNDGIINKWKLWSSAQTHRSDWTAAAAAASPELSSAGFDLKYFCFYGSTWETLIKPNSSFALLQQKSLL